MTRMRLRIHMRKILGASLLYLMAGVLSASNLTLTGADPVLGGTPES